jgi:hypothetical protein
MEVEGQQSGLLKMQQQHTVSTRVCG